jgi:hypothetical protein
MGNHKMGRHHIQVNLASPRVLEITIVEIQRQPFRTKVIQSPNVIIITIEVEMVLAPNTNVVRDGKLIRFTTNLGNGSNGVPARRNLNQSLILLIATIGVIVTPQMVFTNMITITHDYNRPLMNSMATRRYKNANATNKKGGYQEPSIVITQIPIEVTYEIRVFLKGAQKEVFSSIF